MCVVEVWILGCGECLIAGSIFRRLWCHLVIINYNDAASDHVDCLEYGASVVNGAQRHGNDCRDSLK
jgi:hypothetical protein